MSGNISESGKNRPSRVMYPACSLTDDKRQHALQLVHPGTNDCKYTLIEK